MSSPPKMRPAPSIRAGITGTRDLDPLLQERLSRQLSSLFALVRTHVTALLQSTPSLPEIYAADAAGQRLPLLRLLSPLARGADRLAARLALAEGFALHAALPFPCPHYEQDFTAPGELEEFRALLAQTNGNWIALDGDRDHDRNRGYEAAGRFVARNCDLLLAIWDGRPAAGRGGTADIVAFALGAGIPVLWLHATSDQPPRWLADTQDMRDPPPASAPCEPWVTAHLTRLICPPAPCHRHHHGHIDRWARLGRGHHATPLTDYFAAKPLRSSRLWQSYNFLMPIVAGSADRPPRPHEAGPESHITATPTEIPPTSASPGASWDYWQARYNRADQLAIQYADRYRSGYIYTFLFATLSMFCGVTALVLALWEPHGTLAAYHKPIQWGAAGFVALELLMLFLILGLVGLGARGDWHEHSIELRILAELCRKQQALAPLGWTLPVSDLAGFAEIDGAEPERGAWVAWLFAAEQRAAPLPVGTMDAAMKATLQRNVLQQLIAEQQVYHAKREARSRHAASRLAKFGEYCFLILSGCVLLKLSLEMAGLTAGQEGPATHATAILAGWLAIILSAVSAAFVGIRSYTEVPLLAVQSRHVRALLATAARRVGRLDMARPYAAQDLGIETAAVATLMLQDLDGWARLFRVKALEAG